MNIKEITRDKNNSLIYIKDDLIGYTGHQTNNQHPIFYLGKGEDTKEYCDKLNNLTLVAGCVGSGMSLYLETLVLDLANRYPPDELKFILLDPGGFQYLHFAKLPHLACPIIKDMKDSKYIFMWLVSEMQRRYELLEKNKVRYTEQYNEKNPKNKLPHIIFISYQFAESLVTDPESIEKSVVRLAQLNKSIGIHPILISSRPSNNIFTGLIKANTSAFISFTLSNEKDSKEFMGIPDAKNLKGKGDMLYVTGGLKPIRTQAEYLPHEEISKNIENLASRYEQEYDKDLLETLINKTKLKSDEPIDEFIADAINLVQEEGVASASLFQKRFQIGYARSARLIDALEKKGVIGPADGSKPRKLLKQSGSEYHKNMPSDDLMKRAQELDEIRLSNISEKLTLEEAQNIVSVWGAYLEHSGGTRFLFGVNLPESLLPYPKSIIQGALNKMEALYFEQGLHDRVKLLENTEILLIQYTDDEEAIKKTLELFGNTKWQEAMIPGLKKLQETQMENGFLVDKKYWKLSKSRIKELEN